MSARIVLSLSSLALSLVLSGCATSGATAVAFDRLATPVLDVSPFQRVLVAGFVVGGTTDIDANEETVRLLRSQLRTKSPFKVIDGADVLPLADMMAFQPAMSGADGSGGKPTSNSPRRPRNEKDLRAYDLIFANAAYWKRIGEEYLDPMIVTGEVLFTVDTGVTVRAENRDGAEQMDPYGRHWVDGQDPVSFPVERTVCRLRSKFVFIDGRTGAPLHLQVFREEIAYDAAHSIPALSSYFELMDRILPRFLHTVSTQTFRTTRALLQYGIHPVRSLQNEKRFMMRSSLASSRRGVLSDKAQPLSQFTQPQ